jgi:exopolysaccharide production protein ExoQ
MPPYLAVFLCSVGIAGLFYLDRYPHERTSGALWLPVMWLYIVGSRSITSWFGIIPEAGENVQLDGSPIDATIYMLLLSAGIIVLVRRSRNTRTLLSLNWPILLYFAFCLASVSWSDFPGIVFKRWIKAIGDLTMVLIVLTDANQILALKRVFSRCGFILLPFSIVLTKYFPAYGRAYTPDGGMMNTGVTNNKNTLGVITLVLAVGTLWNLVTLVLDLDGKPGRGRHLLAQGALLAIAMNVLYMSHSATSETCFAIAAILMLATQLRMIRRRPSYVHLFVLAMVLGGLAVVFSGGVGLKVLGRDSTFTGRTDIWAAVLAACPNWLVGAGFETFWLGPRLQEVWSHLSRYMHVNEAHNGYIEVYLNLGWVGVCLVAAIILKGYIRSVAVFRREPVIGGMLIAYIVATAFHGVTEASFRLLDPCWIFLLLAVVAASGMSDVRRNQGRILKEVSWYAQSGEAETAAAEPVAWKFSA